MSRKYCQSLRLLILLFGLVPCIAFAANFGVGPMMVELGNAAKTGLVKISNIDASPLQLQVRLFSWTLGAQGESLYEESDDLVFFPHLLEIQPKEERLIRAGIKQPATDKEKSYMLFIEEIPQSQKRTLEDESLAASAKGMKVAVAVRFGVPVFVLPVKPEFNAEVSHIALDKGVLALTVKNTGNTHLVIPEIQLKSEGKFTKSVIGGTILSGSARDYRIAIPDDSCNTIGQLDIVVKTRTEKLEPKAVFKIDKALCR